MKSWFQNHRPRKQRSESQLRPLQMHDLARIDDITPMRTVPVKADANAARIAASNTSSRMSIERYLSAPLEDEPASVPAITAALRGQPSSPRSPQLPVTWRAGHSRESSFDVNSDGQRTFYTSASGLDSTDTSYSIASKTNRFTHHYHHQRSTSLAGVLELPKKETVDVVADTTMQSPERPTISGTVDAERIWTARTDRIQPMTGQESGAAFRAKAQEEIARIQEKARLLEEKMRRYRAEREAEADAASRVTDEMAYSQMAAHPKLAWILGGDATDARSIERPKSSGSVLATTADDIHERPSTSETLVDHPISQPLRRSKSGSALSEKSRRAGSEAGSAMQLERKPSSRLPRFYCTFCQKRFHSRVEWVRHETTIHMPEELWICCPRTGEFPERCPFCSKSHPSPSHLADHNYLSCQEKPLSERTYNRKDHFLLHISQVHKVSPEQKPLRLTELVNAWRHPLPLKSGHQALHCGFCGETFSTYFERTQHVGGHFLDGLDMMSWWSARVSHQVARLQTKEPVLRNPEAPHRCAYCERTYENLATAQKLHPLCSMWSCSFLPGMQYTIYPSGSEEQVDAVCCFCNDTLVKGAGKVKGSVLKDHINQHNFRSCSQRLYFSGQRFRQHLQDSHKTNYDGTLFAGWTLLLKSSKKQKPAVFEPIPESTAVRRAYTDPTAGMNEQADESDNVPLTKMNFMDLSETPLTTTAPRRKLRRKASTSAIQEKPIREVRDSAQFFTRAATMDLAYGKSQSPSPQPGPSGLLSPGKPHQHKPGFPVASLPIDAVNSCPIFYRRRLDASTRNRLYVRDDADKALSKNSQKLFRKVPGSTFGGLVLHSSLVGATPVRMTNSVDIYSLH